jgi:hypothetical protein
MVGTDSTNLIVVCTYIQTQPIVIQQVFLLILINLKRQPVFVLLHLSAVSTSKRIYLSFLMNLLLLRLFFKSIFLPFHSLHSTDTWHNSAYVSSMCVCVCVCVREREREREKENKTDRHKDRKREKRQLQNKRGSHTHSC